MPAPDRREKMSYYLDLTVMQAPRKDLLNTASRIMDWYRTEENAQNYLKEVFRGAPSMRFRRDIHTKEDVRKIRRADAEWIYHVLNFHFILYREMNLIALVGELPEGLVLPEGVKSTVLGFQNSTDQDYSLTGWLDLPVLRKYVFEMTGFHSKKECLTSDKQYNAANSEEGYELRSRVYEKMEELLHIRDYLYRKTNESFTIFTLNAVYESVYAYKLADFLHCFLKEKGEYNYVMEENNDGKNVD